MARTLGLEDVSGLRQVGRSDIDGARVSHVLVVENMNCGGCIRGIEAALLPLPGVAAARANLSTKRVMVTATANQPTAEGMIEALAAAGFRASVLAPEQSGTEPKSDGLLIRCLAVSGFATANIMLLSVAVWAGRGGEMDASVQALMHWVSALIALPTVAYAGRPFFASAAAALSARRINMDVPISLGVVLATAMSLYQTLRHSDQVYFDAAVSLLFFLLIGRVLDQRMRRQAASAAENLLGLRSPMTSVVQEDGCIERMATRLVSPGMRVLIAAGERVPVDARVTRGDAEVDEALITGESQPRRIGVGDQLYSGTINLTAPIEAVATAGEANTLLAEIARLMQSAEQVRGRYVRLADRAARIYAPAVHVLGLATFIGWLIAGYGWEPALTAAIAVLIITCPCALALAVPAVQVAAIGRLFERGIIVKAPDGLERLAEVDTIVFDKTGTLTLGEPRLVAGTEVADDDLARAASLATQSRHPYSRAIVVAAMGRGLSVVPLVGAKEVTGAGLEADVAGRTIRLGSSRFCGVDAEGDARPTLYLRCGDDAAVAFRFEDPVRADAVDVIRRLRTAGYHIELLSGDRAQIVAAAASVVGIDRWQAEQRPDQKAAAMEALRAQGRRVLMVGDGLNDAPALAAGHASISPSSAADISQTTADVVFQGAKLSPVVETLLVAKAAHRSALQNFAVAIGYNIVFVPLAMLGMVTPLLAAVAMSTSSITVTANALLLRMRRLEVKS